MLYTIAVELLPSMHADYFFFREFFFLFRAGFFYLKKKKFQIFYFLFREYGRLPFVKPLSKECGVVSSEINVATG